MAWIGAAVALGLIFVIFVDAFEAMILPRRVRRGYPLVRIYFRSTWELWRAAAKLFPPGWRRIGWLSFFGPLSLFGLLELWAAGLITGFALLHWSLGTALTFPHSGDDGFGTYLYFSGTTFFTLGYGDIVPNGAGGRVLSVIEAGTGFTFLAGVIGYLPVLYQAFSRREVPISMLDARAGSPPSAGELLRRLGNSRALGSVGTLLHEWERWSAELLESHLSYPVLSFYRSQHDNQSWVGALTTILDTTALLISGVEGEESYQARLTFAMARHAAVDLALIFQTRPLPPGADRLSAADLDRLRELLRPAGLKVHDGPVVTESLAKLRGLYEPFVNALAAYLQFPLPPFQPDQPLVDNWQTSAWMRRAPGLGGLPTAGEEDNHFD
jgi:hypothetical protein